MYQESQLRVNMYKYLLTKLVYYILVLSTFIL